MSTRGPEQIIKPADATQLAWARLYREESAQTAQHAQEIMRKRRHTWEQQQSLPYRRLMGRFRVLRITKIPTRPDIRIKRLGVCLGG